MESVKEESSPEKLVPRKVGSQFLLTCASKWFDRVGGRVNLGRLGRAFKPLLSDHSEDEVVNAWGRYLDETDPIYCSPNSFASKIGLYIKKSVQQDYFNPSEYGA